jgi:GTPase
MSSNSPDMNTLNNLTNSSSHSNIFSTYVNNVNTVNTKVNNSADTANLIPLTSATHNQYGSKAGILNNISIDSNNNLPAENDSGSIEYKYKLVGKSAERLLHLTTQMNYRIEEGGGECCYEIGILDNGLALGLNDSEFKESIETIQSMAKQLNCHTEILRVATGVQGKVAEILVRKQLRSLNNDGELCNIRIALIGTLNSGKSTALGCLTNNQLDNGKGSARMNIFKHRHELEQGMTSSISKQILGFDSDGCVTNYKNSSAVNSNNGLDYNYSFNFNHNWHTIIERSSKIITFYDLAGSEQYMKTTIQGLIGSCIDYCVITIAATIGINKTTKEHLVLSLALNIPIIILITKTDLVSPEQLTAIHSSVTTVLQSKACKKQPKLVNSEAELSQIINEMCDLRADNMNNSITPVLSVSSVSGTGFDLFKQLLFLLPRPSHIDLQQLVKKPTQFYVDSIYNIDDIGLILAGTIKAGSISVGQTLLLGPISLNPSKNSNLPNNSSNDSHSSSTNGNCSSQFIPIQINSIHSNRCPIKSCSAGHNASLTFAVVPNPLLPLNGPSEISKEMLRRGQVLLDSAISPSPRACYAFEASIQVLNLASSAEIGPNYAPVVHISTIAQCARIVECVPARIKSGQFAQVKFEFIYWPEFIQLQQKLIIREGTIKGIGVINKLYYENEEIKASSSSTETSPNKTRLKQKSNGLHNSNSDNCIASNNDNNFSSSLLQSSTHNGTNNHTAITHSQSDQMLSNHSADHHSSENDREYPIVATPLTRSISVGSDDLHNNNTNNVTIAAAVEIDNFTLNNSISLNQ